MIKYFRFDNFFSIEDDAILEFDSKIQDYLPFPANPIIGVAGGNASGKTNVLKGITFIQWFIKHSFYRSERDSDIPFFQFLPSQKKTSSFYVEFSVKKDGRSKDWINYFYHLILTKNQVIEEKLEYAPLGRKKLIFNRSKNSVKLGSSIAKISVKDLRKNCSYISYASQFPTQKVINKFSDFQYYTNVDISGFKEKGFNASIMKGLVEDKDIYKKAKELIRIADVGITDFYLRDAKDILQVIDVLIDNKEQFKALSKKEQETILRLKDDASDNSNKIVFTNFLHTFSNKSLELSENEQSSGTLQFMCLIDRVLYALRDGSVIIIDEIELKLHQNLVAYLIGLFQNKKENKKGAQLFFSFHNSLFMDLLDPTQLWFTEKGDSGSTEVFSANSFKDISNLRTKSLEKLYRAGRFGATPREL